ncbi:MAG TPA: uracil-DNA glycosylase [Dysgonamonadaceae bacterium]|nr:uracil-DNA glycosylase [Dysgonamonadaceae bacterium]
MHVIIEESWKNKLENEFNKPYFKTLTDFVREEYSTQQIFPPAKLIFNAFDKCPFHEVKVVIIGQDPYHNPGQANGLCFSVNDGVQIPPSLLNIYKEIKEDLGKNIPKSGNLEHWSKQGVLLLNATLTVRAHRAGSHQGKGWERFTDSVIDMLSSECGNIIFMLWGNFAQQKGKNINPNKHLVLKSAHPSPLSAHRGFFGCKHFSKTNDYLIQKGKKPIDW